MQTFSGEKIPIYGARDPYFLQSPNAVSLCPSLMRNQVVYLDFVYLFVCVFIDAELKGVKQDNQSVLGIRLKFESGLKNLMRFLCLSP